LSMENVNTAGDYPQCTQCGRTIGIIEERSETQDGFVCSECSTQYEPCMHCGSLVHIDKTVGDNHTFICETCYEEHYIFCSQCRCLTPSDETYYIFDDAFCNDCYQDLRVCAHCNEPMHTDEPRHEIHGEYMVCECCLDKHYEHCDCCLEFFKHTELTTIDGLRICDECQSKGD
jgi:hypothetical protein